MIVYFCFLRIIMSPILHFLLFVSSVTFDCFLRVCVIDIVITPLRFSFLSGGQLLMPLATMSAII